MPHALVYPILVLCSLLIGAVITTVVVLAHGLRRKLGAKRRLPPDAYIAIVLLALLHGGYFASPFLLAKGYRGLALGLTIPLAAIVTIGLAAIIGKLPHGPSLFVDRPRFTFFLSLLAVAYWCPAGALMFAA